MKIVKIINDILRFFSDTS